MEEMIEYFSKLVFDQRLKSDDILEIKFFEALNELVKDLYFIKLIDDESEILFNSFLSDRDEVKKLIESRVELLFSEGRKEILRLTQYLTKSSESLYVLDNYVCDIEDEDNEVNLPLYIFADRKILKKLLEY